MRHFNVGLLVILALLLGACTIQVPAAAPAQPETAAEAPAEAGESTEPAEEPMAEVPWEDVTLGFGGTIPLSHPGVYVGVTEGFWEDEHINFTVQGNEGSVQSIQLLDAGQVNFAQITPETLVNAQKEGIDAVSVYTVNKFSSKLCTLADKAIEDVAELKGQRIGIPAATSGQVYFVRAMLDNAGLNPDTDVEYVPTGFGPAAAENLANGDVAAVGYWGGWYIGAEEMGYEFDCHVLPGMESAPGHVLVTMRETVENNPDLVERVGRAYAKSIVFAIANPEATVNSYWELYPEVKATDMPEDELLASSTRQVVKALEDFVFDYPGWQHGHNNPEGWAALVQFMVDTGQLPESIPAEQLINNDFVDAFNDFDHAAVEAPPQQ